MPNQVFATRITVRVDTKANWLSADPVLLLGELALEFDPSPETNSYQVKIKAGDGTHVYSALPYTAGQPMNLPVPDGTTIVDDNNVWKLAGFDNAQTGTFPVKRVTEGVSSIEWVALPAHFADLDTLYSTVMAHVADTNNPHSVTAAQVGALPDTTKYGASLVLSIDSTTYVVTATLKDQDGNTLGTAQTIDLPLESVVVSGTYDAATKEVVLTLQGGSTVRFSVADLVSGLQTEITSVNMLDADLVDDTTSAHKFVTAAEKTKLAGIEDNAEENTIESISVGGTAVSPDANKNVDIPIATASVLGVVLSSTAGDQILVGADGKMTVNSLSTDKLVQGTNTIILQCGGASV